MTDTLSRPATKRPAIPARGPRRPLEVGLLGAIWAVCAGLVATAVPVLLVWAADGRSGSGAAAAMRTAGQVWLVAHGTSLALPDGMLGLTPLGLAVLPVCLLLRAAGHGAHECKVTSLRTAGVLSVSIAVPYGVLAAVVAAASSTAQVQPVAWQALLAGWVVGGVGGLAGAIRAAGLWPAVLPALPARARLMVAPTAAALGVLMAGGAALAGCALAAHLGRARDLASATAPGKVGGVALLLLGLVLVPNAAIWAGSWLVGTGFHVGVGTAVGPYGTHLGPVPSLPLLAALPGPVPGWVGVLGLLVPVAGGAVGGVVLLRRLGPSSWSVACREAALIGPVAGVVVAVLGWLSGGATGGGRLVDVGPSPWRLGLAAALEVSVGAAAAAAVVVRRRVSP